MARKTRDAVLAGLRILIADDSSIVRGAIRDLLQGCEDVSALYESADGEGAVEQARTLKPDVVLLDLGVPAAAGFEIAARLIREHPSVTVIVISQQDPSVLQKLTEHYGLRLCLPKSALASELAPMLRGIAAKSPHS